MKTLKTAAALVLLLVFCTGCMNPVRINQRAIIQGIGIDLEEGEYLLTLQIFDPQGGGSQTAVDVGKSNSLIVQAKGVTIAEALETVSLKQGKQVFYGQNKLIVLGSEAAHGGLGEVLRFFGASMQSRPNVDLVVAQGRAAEVLEAKINQSVMPVLAIKSMLDNEKVNGEILRGPLMHAIASQENGSTGCAMPLVAKSGGGENEAVELLGTAVFRQGVLAGAVGPRETRGILWLRGEVQKTQMVVEAGELGRLSLRVISAETTVHPSLVNGVPHFTVRCKVKSHVAENLAGGALTERAREIEERQAAAIRAEMEAALAACLAGFQSDVFGLANLLQKYEPEWFAQNEAEYEQQLPAFRFALDVTCELMR